MSFRQPPEPSYEYEISRLVAAYKDAVARIKRELENLDISGLSRANTAAALAEISRILASLNAESAAWVEVNIPRAARDGIAQTLVNLGVVETIAQAETVVTFNRMNANMVAAAIADTQADLLAVTQNIDRKVRSAVRQAVADSMRANMAAGANGRRTISRDILDRMRKSLGDSVNTGIIDATGRRWRPEVYAEMVTRTKIQLTHIEAVTNEAVERGALYGVISSHGATDACRYHEGRVIKLVSNAPGDYPTYEALRASNQIFHPFCRHTVHALRDVSLLPPSLRDKADSQAEIGDKALATGKRNPIIE